MPSHDPDRGAAGRRSALWGGDRVGAACGRASRRRFAVARCLLPVLLLLVPACAERRIRVTSTPPGARVWLNDEDVGRTPTEARFTFYGHYDVRLELEGFEPYNARHTARAPLHEYPGPDLVAAAVPARIRHTVEWHVDLSPTPESSQDADAVRRELVDRAAAMRERTAGAAD